MQHSFHYQCWIYAQAWWDWELFTALLAWFVFLDDKIVVLQSFKVIRVVHVMNKLWVKCYRRLRGLCVLKASSFKCQSICLIDQSSTLDQLLDRHLMGNPIDTQSTIDWQLNWYSINSRPIVGQGLTDFDQKLVNSWMTAIFVSPELFMESWSRVDQHLTADAFSTHNPTY